MTAPEVGTTGMPCRMPLIRSRPWISDSVWCIHESLPAVASIAKMLPLNGLWRFTADGPPSQWADPDVNTLVALDLYREAGTSPWSL